MCKYWGWELRNVARVFKFFARARAFNGLCGPGAMSILCLGAGVQNSSHVRQMAMYPDPTPVIPLPDTGVAGVTSLPSPLLFSKGIPYFLLPNLDSVNHCTSKYLSISILISLLVQWLTESRFAKRNSNSAFRSLM